MKRATVLGSGGVIGIAWLTGIVEGLREAGVDPIAADTLIGTSAGSVVATRLTTTRRASGPPAPGSPPDRAALMGGVDPEAAREVFSIWSAMREPDPEAAARIGALACTHKLDGEQLVRMYETTLGDPEWPEVDLRIVGVDTATGERVVFRAGGEARVARAVGASTAVPGMFPPVPMGATRVMDGGVHSTTNADLLLDGGFDRVVVAMPTCEVTARSLGVLAERCLEGELAALRERGVEVEVLMPQARDRGAYGQGLMDASHATQAQEAAREQARREADRIAAFWA